MISCLITHDHRTNLQWTSIVIFSCSLLLFVDTRDKHCGDAVVPCTGISNLWVTAQHKARRGCPLLCCFRLISHCFLLDAHCCTPCSLFRFSHSTRYTQDQLKDTARITSQVNWRYNQHKRKGLVTTLKLL